jgi:hypothetical protein
MASAQLRGRRAGIPSFKTPMICPSVNLLPRMPSSCRFLGGLSLSVDLFSGGTSLALPMILMFAFSQISTFGLPILVGIATLSLRGFRGMKAVIANLTRTSQE